MDVLVTITADIVTVAVAIAMNTVWLIVAMNSISCYTNREYFMLQLPSPWILSPIKSTPVDANTDPHFLEMIFSEDEEDEEYVPTETELKVSVLQVSYKVLFN